MSVCGVRVLPLSVITVIEAQLFTGASLWTGEQSARSELESISKTARFFLVLASYKIFESLTFLMQSWTFRRLLFCSRHGFRSIHMLAACEPNQTDWQALYICQVTFPLWLNSDWAKLSHMMSLWLRGGLRGGGIHGSTDSFRYRLEKRENLRLHM